MRNLVWSSFPTEALWLVPIFPARLCPRFGSHVSEEIDLPGSRFHWLCAYLGRLSTRSLDHRRSCHRRGRGHFPRMLHEMSLELLPGKGYSNHHRLACSCDYEQHVIMCVAEGAKYSQRPYQWQTIGLSGCCGGMMWTLSIAVASIRHAGELTTITSGCVHKNEDFRGIPNDPKDLTHG